MTHKPEGHGRGRAAGAGAAGLPRPDRGVGRGPGARGLTVQMVIAGGWGGVGKGRQSPTRGFPRLA